MATEGGMPPANLIAPPEPEQFPRSDRAVSDRPATCARQSPAVVGGKPSEHLCTDNDQEEAEDVPEPIVESVRPAPIESVNPVSDAGESVQPAAKASNDVPTESAAAPSAAFRSQAEHASNPLEQSVGGDAAGVSQDAEDMANTAEPTELASARKSQPAVASTQPGVFTPGDAPEAPKKLEIDLDERTERTNAHKAESRAPSATQPAGLLKPDSEASDILSPTCENAAAGEKKQSQQGRGTVPTAATTNPPAESQADITCASGIAQKVVKDPSGVETTRGAEPDAAHANALPKEPSTASNDPSQPTTKMAVDIEPQPNVDAEPCELDERLLTEAEILAKRASVEAWLQTTHSAIATKDHPTETPVRSAKDKQGRSKPRKVAPSAQQLARLRKEAKRLSGVVVDKSEFAAKGAVIDLIDNEKLAQEWQNGSMHVYAATDEDSDHRGRPVRRLLACAVVQYHGNSKWLEIVLWRDRAYGNNPYELRVHEILLSELSKESERCYGSGRLGSVFAARRFHLDKWFFRVPDLAFDAEGFFNRDTCHYAPKTDEEVALWSGRLALVQQAKARVLLPAAKTGVKVTRFGGLPPPLQREASETLQREMPAADEPTEVLAVVCAGHVVGAALASRAGPDSLRIEAIRVQPHCRRHGVGRLLVACLEALAASLQTAPVPAESNRFWEKAGFLQGPDAVFAKTAVFPAMPAESRAALARRDRRDVAPDAPETVESASNHPPPTRKPPPKRRAKADLSENNTTSKPPQKKEAARRPPQKKDTASKPPQKKDTTSKPPQKKDAARRPPQKDDSTGKPTDTANKPKKATAARKPAQKSSPSEPTKTQDASKLPPKGTPGKPSKKRGATGKPPLKKAAAGAPPEAEGHAASTPPQQAEPTSELPVSNEVEVEGKGEALPESRGVHAGTVDADAVLAEPARRVAEEANVKTVGKPKAASPRKEAAKGRKRTAVDNDSKTQPAAKKSKREAAVVSPALPEGTPAKADAGDATKVPATDKRGEPADTPKPDAKRRKRDDGTTAAIGGKLKEIAERPKPESRHHPSSELKRLSCRKATDELLRASAPEEAPNVPEFPFVHAGVNYPATTKGRQDWFLHMTSPEHTAGLCSAIAATMPQRLSDESIARLREAADSTADSPAALVAFTGVLLLARRLSDMNLCKPAEAKKIASAANARVASLKALHGHLALVPLEGCSSASWWDLHTVVDA
eukprot:gene4092-6360_t